MIDKNKIWEHNFLKPFEPFKGIIWFLILFLLFEFIWKLCVHQGDNEAILLILGKDFTPYTTPICLWTAKAVYFVVHTIFGYQEFKINGIYLYFENSLRLDIIWGCTGIKQVLMFTFIMIFYFGPKKKKLWFIPLSIFALLTINILRIAIICVIVKDSFPTWFIPVNEWYNNHTWTNTRSNYWLFYRDWFDLFHKDVFTWIYYDGVIFILWLIWEEKINKPYQKVLAKMKSQKQPKG